MYPDLTHARPVKYLCPHKGTKIDIFLQYNQMFVSSLTVTMAVCICTCVYCEQYPRTHNMLSSALCDVLFKAANDWFLLLCRFMELDVICCISLISLKETGIE